MYIYIYVYIEANGLTLTSPEAFAGFAFALPPYEPRQDLGRAFCHSRPLPPHMRLLRKAAGPF